MITDLIKPIGILTYLFVLLAVLTGIKIIKVPLKIHKSIALIGIVLATIHTLIVIYLTYF